MSAKLRAALGAVDWNANVQNLLLDDDLTARIEHCNLQLAIWARQFEAINDKNPALAFIREMQHGGHNVACTIALALYKPAASAMRSLLECALYFTYFKSHSVELCTLVRDAKFYVSKKDILFFYAKHVPDFSKRQGILNYLERLETWYSQTSAIVHGQIPGMWSNGSSVVEIGHDKVLLEEVVEHFERSIVLVRDTFLCVLGAEIWAFVEADAKAVFCKGLSGEIKAALKIDLA